MNATDAGARSRMLPAAGVLGMALVLAAATFGLFFYNARANRETIRTVGSASHPFTADIVKWRMMVSRAAPEGGLPQAYTGIRDDVQRLRARLAGAGIADSAITLQPVNAQPMWNREGQRSGYQLQQFVTVVSRDVDGVERLALDPATLASDGLVLEASQLEYFYSGIAELKHSLLADATRDARRRAEEIASSSDADVGPLRTARAGVFQITEPFSTEVSDMGIHNTASRRKEITVTVHAEFGLE